MINGRRRLTSPVLRRESEVSRKPLRRECRIVSALPDDLCAFLFFEHARLAGAASARHSLHPLISGGTPNGKTRTYQRRGNVEPRFPLSCPANGSARSAAR